MRTYAALYQQCVSNNVDGSSPLACEMSTDRLVNFALCQLSCDFILYTTTLMGKGKDFMFEIKFREFFLV